MKDEGKRRGAVEAVTRFCGESGLHVEGTVESPITGTDGNVEYLICLKRIDR